MDNQLYILTYIYQDEDNSSYQCDSLEQAQEEMRQTITDLADEYKQEECRVEISSSPKKLSMSLKVDGNLIVKSVIAPLYD